uniref:methylcrotonoyl-CoA carboxylase n=1 Tax=Pygocentrus nattereri TaxID=42514 RepID=A0A3B4E3W6_PYGNA
ITQKALGSALHRYMSSYGSGRRLSEHREKLMKGGGERAIYQHTQRKKKFLVRERLHMLLDDEDYLELCPFAGLGLPYGDVPSASSVAGIGKINGLWCVFIANDATVKAGLTFPISVTKTLRAQEVAIKNRLPCVYLVDNSGVFLPLQAVIVQRIGTVALAGPPLVKAATGEEVSPEDLGGAKLHTEVSGCIDYFASVESEAYQCSRNIITTFNFELPEESITEVEGPLYSAEELMGLAPKSYNYSLDIRLVDRLTDGSRLQEFKARYGTTLLTGFARVEG